MLRNSTYWRNSINGSVRPEKVRIFTYEKEVKSWAEAYELLISKLLNLAINKEDDVLRLIQWGQARPGKKWFALDPSVLKCVQKDSSKAEHHFRVFTLMQQGKQDISVYAEIDDKGSDLCYRFERTCDYLGIEAQWDVKLVGETSWLLDPRNDDEFYRPALEIQLGKEEEDTELLRCFEQVEVNIFENLRRHFHNVTKLLVTNTINKLKDRLNEQLNVIAGIIDQRDKIIKSQKIEIENLKASQLKNNTALLAEIKKVYDKAVQVENDNKNLVADLQKLRGAMNQMILNNQKMPTSKPVKGKAVK